MLCSQPPKRSLSHGIVQKMGTLARYYHPNQMVDTSILRKVYSLPNNMNASGTLPMSTNTKPVFPLLPQAQSQQLAC